MNSSVAPLLFVISGPSGAGKSGAVRFLVVRGLAKRVTTYTSRAQRPDEIDGEEYHFTTREEIAKLASEGRLADITERYSGALYASPVEVLSAQPPDPLVVGMDISGYRRIRAKAERRVVGVFLAGPSQEVLVERLMERGTSATDVSLRNEDQRQLLPLACEFDHLLLNEREEDFYLNLEALVRTEIRACQSWAWWRSQIAMRSNSNRSLD